MSSQVNWDTIYTAAVMAELVYVHAEVAPLAAMARWLDFEELTWRRTPGNVVCNFIVGRSEAGVVVAISGTEDWRQILFYSLLNTLAPNDQLRPLPGIRCSIQFGAIAEAVRILLMPYLEGVEDGTPFTFIGHSLGGAVAQYLAIWFDNNVRVRVANVITFGAPRLGGSDLCVALGLLPNVIVRNEGDPIPFLPPEIGVLNFRKLRADPLTLFYGFTMPDPQYVLSWDATFQKRGQQFSEWNHFRVRDMLYWLSIWNRSGQTQFLQYIAEHRMGRYVERVRQVALVEDFLHDSRVRDEVVRLVLTLQRASEDQSELTDAQTRDFLRALFPSEFQVADVRPQLPLARQVFGGPSVTTFDDSTPMPSALLAIPDALPLTGQSRPHWLYRGKDRNLLLSLRECLHAIAERDAIALGRPETTAVSTRQPIIDPAQPDLAAAFNLLLSQVDYLVQLRKLPGAA